MNESLVLRINKKLCFGTFVAIPKQKCFLFWNFLGFNKKCFISSFESKLNHNSNLYFLKFNMVKANKKMKVKVSYKQPLKTRWSLSIRCHFLERSSTVKYSKFEKYPRYFRGDGCSANLGRNGSMSYVIKGCAHFPHISVGDEDIRRDGFHVTVEKGQHIFFRLLRNYPYCCPVVYDRVSIEALWCISNYAKEFAMELLTLRIKDHH